MGNKAGRTQSQSKWEVRSSSVEAINHGRRKEAVASRKSNSLSRSSLGRVKTKERLSREPMAEKPMSQDTSSADGIATRIGRYKISNVCVGVGAFSQVRLGVDTRTGREVAVKIIPKKNQHERARFNREKEFLSQMHHPNIVRLFDSAEDETHMYMILEYIEGGDLVDYLEHHGKMTEKKAQRVFHQLLDALEYCHQKGIAHRDVKLENVLLCRKTKTVKLIDFGLAARMTQPSALFTEYCGSPVYCSPEVVSNQPYDGTENDVWSLGIVLYTLLTGEFPFWDEEQRGLFHKIRHQEIGFPIRPRLSEYVKDLILAMLRKEGAYRPSLEDIRAHPWLAVPNGHFRRKAGKGKTMRTAVVLPDHIEAAPVVAPETPQTAAASPLAAAGPPESPTTEVATTRRVRTSPAVYA